MKRMMTWTAVFGLVLTLVPGAWADTYNWADPSNGGEWVDAGNWTETTGSGYPDGVGDIARFNPTGHDSDDVFSVNVASPITVGQIHADLASGWNFPHDITGDGPITFDNDGASNKAGVNGALIKMDTWHYYTLGTWSVPMVLADDLLISTFAQRKMNLHSTISGTGELTLNRNFEDLTIGGASRNTYSGGTTIKNAFTLVLNKEGALGTGDVEVSDHRSGLRITNITGSDEDRIDDSASLYLTSNGSTLYSKVTLDTGVNETVARLYFDDVEQAAGTWGSTSSAAENKNDNFFAGTGMLTIPPPPPPAGTLLIFQ